METNWDELRFKEVIRIADGCRLGYPGNLEIDLDNGRILSLVIPGKRRLFGLLGREADQKIPWGLIHKFGDELILVDELPSPSTSATQTKSQRQYQ